tara:strand:+ start:298 stop:663 length:366 start_codon:yes stop_codon:yes gene_type:complete
MSTIKVGTLLAADGSTTTQPSIPALDKRMAQAWIKFKGNATVAILASYGVSSLTDHGTGSYYVNFSTAFADANYAFTSSSNQTTCNSCGNTESGSVFRFMVRSDSGTFTDADICASSFFSN